MNHSQSPQSPLSQRRQSHLRQRFPNLRIASWQGDNSVALVGPSRSGRLADVSAIASCLSELAGQGVREAVTPALTPQDAQPFFQAGFEHYEHLHLLSRRLLSQPDSPKMKTKPGRRWHLSTVLDIDRRAFDDFWRFDKVALNEARHATPASRYRVLAIDRKIVGYHVTGRAGNRGYLQRLAVDPDHAGNGVGTALLFDCLTWLYRHKALEALVNTQERNERALQLYERHGFVRQAEGLVVLSWKAPS